MLPKLIAIDFDETFTADPDLWKSFISQAIGRGHKVICVTARRDTYERRREVLEALPPEVPAYFAYDRPKRDYMHKVHGMWPDIWIDDVPEGV